MPRRERAIHLVALRIALALRHELDSSLHHAAILPCGMAEELEHALGPGLDAELAEIKRLKLDTLYEGTAAFDQAVETLSHELRSDGHE